MTEVKDGTLVTTAPEQRALEVGDYKFTPEQVALIKRTVAAECSDDELMLFVHVCRRLKLDPIAKQIYAVKYGGKMVIQTGIDGFRLIAERTGEFRGSSDPEWCGEDGVWKDVWTDRANFPAAARVRVLRGKPGDLEPVSVTGIANFSEYVALSGDKPNSRWSKAPAAMLAKCAEALAIRRAFPSELAGLFTFDETSSSYDKSASKPQIEQPKRKSEAAKPAETKRTLPSENPWVGDLSDIKAKDIKGFKFWELQADAGAVTFGTDQQDLHDRAADAMSNARQVRIEWKITKSGNAWVDTLIILSEG